jgi:P4 family phage/plasmid primase-like protien
MKSGSSMNEGSPQRSGGLTPLIKAIFPEDPVGKKIVSDLREPEAFGNLEDAEKFLKALADDSLVTFQTFDDKGKDKSLIRIMHGSLSEHLAELIDLNRRGAGIYSMVNLGDGKGRKEKNVVAIRDLILDLDGSPLNPVLEWILKPHLITETSPGRYQCFWIVIDFPCDKALLSAVQGAICTKFEGDPKVTKDLCRVMRVPGFFHNKKDPYLSKLVQVNDHPPFSKDEILKELDVNPSKTKPQKTASRKGDVGKVIHEHDRNDSLISLGGTMRRRGFSGEAIEAALQVENTIKCDGPLEPEEVSDIAKSAAKYDPAALPIGRDFHPMPYVHAIREEFAVIAHEGEFYRYKNGVYEQWPRQEIDQLILALSFESARPRHCDEIRKSLETVCYTSPEQVNKAGLLNLKNGILDPKTAELHEHSPEHYMTTQIPVEWDPQAECPTFDRFLKKVLPEEDQRTLLMQIFGYSLTTDTRFQKAFILLGEGSNGKSICIKILEALLGSACSAIELSDLKSQFLIAELQNKTANLSSEQNTKDFVQDAMLKKIISGDSLVAQRKFKDPFKFRPLAKLILTANRLPKTYDRSYGYFRRWIILRFEITIPEEEWDLDLDSKIIKSELSGVLRKAVDALRGLYKFNKFAIPESSKRAIADYEREMNPMLVFFEEYVEERSGSVVSLQEIFTQYQTWCHFNNHKPVGSQKLREGFEKKFGVQKTRISQGRIFRGYFCRKVDRY